MGRRGTQRVEPITERARARLLRELATTTDRLNIHVGACSRCRWAHQKKKPAMHWCAFSVGLHMRAREIERELYPDAS